MRRNYSQGIPYHTQRNNQIVPYGSCNTTAMVMALLQAGHDLPPHYDKQPEDELSRLLREKEAYDAQKKLAPWAVGKFPPQETHACLKWGVERWMGRGHIDVFRTTWRKSDLLVHLDSGGGVVLSGRFPIETGELGHIVSLAGYETLEEDGGEVVRWIIDDPSGNWHTSYIDQRGNDVNLSVDEFDMIFGRHSGIWAHLVEPA